MARKPSKEEFSDEDLKGYIALAPAKKLKHLEEMNKFLNKIRPKRAKRIAAQLKAEGF